MYSTAELFGPDGSGYSTRISDLGYIVRYVQSRAEYEYRTSSRQEVGTGLFPDGGRTHGRTDARMDATLITPEQTKFVICPLYKSYSSGSIPRII